MTHVDHAQVYNRIEILTCTQNVFSLFFAPFMFAVNSLSPLNMPDYAEVAGCSTFRNTTTSPMYDTFGAYATTNLVRNANLFTSYFPHRNQKNNSVYSAPTICHFNTNDGHNFAHSNTNCSTNKSASKMNIIENKIDVINNLSHTATASESAAAAPTTTSTAASTSIKSNGIAFGTATSASKVMTSVSSVPTTPIIGIGTMRRNRLPKIGHCDKISFGGCDNGRTIDQPLFIKSKEDGSWMSVQNSAYHFTTAALAAKSVRDGSSLSVNGASASGSGGVSDNTHKINTSNNSFNNNCNNNGSANVSASQIYLSSFGRADNV